MLNSIIVMGRLTRDPELRRTASGIAVANFTLAVDRDYADENKERETDFIDCVAWRNTGEFVSKYFTKGRMAVVQGRLEIRNWTDKDGNKRRSAEIKVDNAYFADSKKSDQGGAPAPQEPGYNGFSQPQPVPGGVALQGYQGAAPVPQGYQGYPTENSYPPQGGYQQPQQNAAPQDGYNPSADGYSNF